METKREINWKQAFQDAQETLDAYRRGALEEDEYFVTGTGNISAQDLDTRNWVTIPAAERVRMKDSDGKL